MRKILIGILIILLVVLAYFAIFKGISIGNVKILSIKQMSEANDRLDAEITATDTLMNNDYKTRTSELDTSVTNLLNAKKEYEDLTSVSTESEIEAASKTPVYSVEFLLTRLGRHTTAQGVDLEYKILTGCSENSDIKNISFTVKGLCPRIVNFLRVIEDDDELGFRIQNFKLVPEGDNLTATFLVTNVKVKQEQLTSQGGASTTTSASAEQNANTQNTENTGNTANAGNTENTETTN